MEQDIYFYDEKNNSALILADTFEFLEKIKPQSIDMIFADPPYFLSNGGFTCNGGRRVLVDKGDWDKIGSAKEKHRFNRKWIKMVKRILKPDGTIWISGTLHNIYSVGMALEQEGYKILNNITWQKKDPPPNLSHQYFTHSTETILWARKNIDTAHHYYNYELMKKYNYGMPMTDVWIILPPRAKEKVFGKHPTQKPEYLLERIILSSTKKGDLILDPFVGSGTTSVVAKKLGRRYIGIDREKRYLDLGIKRLNDIK